MDTNIRCTERASSTLTKFGKLRRKNPYGGGCVRCGTYVPPGTGCMLWVSRYEACRVSC